MKQKKILVYSNPICYFDTDCTVLHHLNKEYHVIWYPTIHANGSSKKYTFKELEQYAKKNDIEFKPIIMNFRFRSFKNWWYYASLLREIKKQHADIVFTSTDIPYWHFLILFFLKRRCIVHGLHNVEPHSGSHLCRLQSCIDIMRRNLYTNYITYSKNQQLMLIQKYGVYSTCVGMSIKDFGSSTLIPEAIERKVKLLFFGRICSYKGLDILIEALEKTHSQGINNIQLSICGDGSHWEKCYQLIKTPSLYNLQIRFIKNDEIANLMSTHHFIIFPYRDVSNSGPMMIALNYQLPIIAPNISGFRDVYDSESAIIYEQNCLQDAICQVALMNCRKYKAMKMACSKLRNKYREDIIAKNYMTLFNNVCQ